jgi:hypothetical protein
MSVAECCLGDTPERWPKPGALDSKGGLGRIWKVSGMNRSTLVALVVSIGALGSVAPHVAASVDEESGSPRLTNIVPRSVAQVCASGRTRSPLPLICPPLVPRTKYRTSPGASGVLLGNTNRPPVKPPADRIYLLAFNGGDAGPTYWHWIAGMGTREAIRYWVLSDARNEVKGKPRRVRTILVGRRSVEIWRFPENPAGGQFGGHLVAITCSGPYLAIASVHGFDTADASVRIAVALARKADAAR